MQINYANYQICDFLNLLAHNIYNVSFKLFFRKNLVIYTIILDFLSFK